jgi:preprotein translocase subunit SecY
LTYYAMIVATFVAATALLSWLGDRITLQGFGDGFWLLLVAPYLAGLPNTAFVALELSRRGEVSASAMFAAFGCVMVAIAVTVALAKAHHGQAASHGATSRSGASAAAFVDVWPPVLAQYVPALVVVALSLILGAQIQASLLAFGNPLHLLMIATLIVGFTLLRASAPDGVVAAGRPVRLTALAQIVICGGGEWLTRGLNLPFAIDGAWLIIIVATAMTALNGAGGTVRVSAAGEE